jgi:hypothetical protein
MNIAYSVLYINEDLTVKDLLWERRVVYDSWEKAIKACQEIAINEIKRCEKWNMISLVSSNSKNNCDKKGKELIFSIIQKEIGVIGEFYIVPVHIE